MDITIHLDYLSVHDSLCIRKIKVQNRKGTRGPFLVNVKVSEHISSKLEPITGASKRLSDWRGLVTKIGDKLR